MAWETRNVLYPSSGLLPSRVIEVGLDPDGITAWCTYRGEANPICSIVVDVEDGEAGLARDLEHEHLFEPMHAIDVAARLFTVHRATAKTDPDRG